MTPIAPLRRRLGALFLACLAAPSLALAQAPYPSKPIRLVVPFAAGGAVDTVGRVVGERLSTQMGQPVIVDNRPGANANIGTENVARSAPDGYSLLVAANGVVTNNTLYPKLSFNGLRDFVAVARLGYAPLVLVVPASAPYKSVPELLAAARAKPGDMSYGSAGNGSSGHLAGALLASVGKFDALHVAYKGGSPALVDLIAGRTSFMLLNPLEVLPHIQSGRLRALAVSGAQRAPMLPNVPTMAEAGLPNFDASVWWTLLAPAGTAPEVVAKLNAETRKALADAGTREKLGALGAVITPSSPQEAAAFLKSESAKWEQVIRAADIKAD
ncbi:LacI family transcriptional regulator [Variovorax paradoxus]|jgi:tripartite-type tricarboxylate transporter receptor subunit TctC|uniref:Bug family tripartite tricarboxylate transporter substrate binding protein n=1 Tax=Variovorax TaxID=34072 RepID=UPI0006E6B695|nr:tripartite tricarboxylate transporter substrate binding protein [Variovorax sp.]KPU94322.1 LacI family transcriptional regulator [Variovorax paradoxus]KPU96332.1 LacI family transcriptional regulator [Variovorax paradoxus]KPU98849.1 LacI family transcriptional regulator [Variovorax paradoxus]KPV23884.1 LacI family transcriptional regulator [Variovorax paradoxus]KPV25429.1 LacI family transcriptional regulator [Variovorax paradoxus]